MRYDLEIECIQKPKKIDISYYRKQIVIETCHSVIHVGQENNWVWFQNYYLPNNGQYIC